jgi:CoA:oxalate CoA-transferase
VTGIRLLQGIRVVSLEQYISGPYCTQILADAGAEVIKVERPGSGDPRRWYDPKRGTDDDFISGGFASYNRGKKSVCLELTDDSDNLAFGELLGTADVLVSNLRPGGLARNGWPIERLRVDFPALIVCEITGFGTSGGPYAAWPAFDSVIQAMSGLSSLLGESPQSPPGLAPMGTIDMLSGIWAALGVLAALVGRTTTGAGAHIDTAMYDVGASLVERPLALYEFTGEVTQRGADDFSPVGAFRAGDGGWISIVIPTDEMWRRCCAVVGDPELESDPELDTVLKRSARMRDVIVPRLEAWAHDMDRYEAAGVLRAGGQPAGVVQNIDEVRRCEHLRHREFFTELDDDRAVDHDGQPLRLARTPLLFDGVGATPGRVPILGEHTQQILASLGEQKSSPTHDEVQ